MGRSPEELVSEDGEAEPSPHIRGEAEADRTNTNYKMQDNPNLNALSTH
jgi:hypothetical protein